MPKQTRRNRYSSRRTRRNKKNGGEGTPLGYSKAYCLFHPKECKKARLTGSIGPSAEFYTANTAVENNQKKNTSVTNITTNNTIENNPMKITLTPNVSTNNPRKNTNKTNKTNNTLEKRSLKDTLRFRIKDAELYLPKIQQAKNIVLKSNETSNVYPHKERWLSELTNANSKYRKILENSKRQLQELENTK
jgi:hypothetical protein